MTPADELRTAEERVRMGDRRIDISLRGPLAVLLDWAGDSYTASVAAAQMVWGDLEHPEAQRFIDREGVPAEVLALARAINGSAP